MIEPDAPAESRHPKVDTTEPTAAAPTRRERRAADRSGRRATSGSTRGSVLNLGIMTLAAGLVATMALPAYAFNPNATNGEGGDSAVAEMRETAAQAVDVDAAAPGTTVARDAYTATTTEELRAAADAAAAAEAAEQAQAAREEFATTYASYSGPSAKENLENPPYPDFSLDQVFSVAQQYQGVPYVYGGDDPSGFDCSGFVMYVYSQFGISLPHGVRGQANLGTVISREDARPGDLVIFNNHSHNGFYAGDGKILDAPRPGKAVQTRPLWTDAVYFVRIGI